MAMRKIFFLIALGTFFLVSFAHAQSVVYFCSQTNQWGYSYGGGNMDNNDRDAYQRCMRSGGKAPQRIVATHSKGFGAIAVGKDQYGVPKFGTSAGARTMADAVNAANASCRKYGALVSEIKETWEDR